MSTQWSGESTVGESPFAAGEFPQEAPWTEAAALGEIQESSGPAWSASPFGQSEWPAGEDEWAGQGEDELAGQGEDEWAGQGEDEWAGQGEDELAGQGEWPGQQEDEWTGVGESTSVGEWNPAGESTSLGEWNPAGEWGPAEIPVGESTITEAPSWSESPFSSEAPGGGQLPSGDRCPDRQFGDKPWTVSRPGRHKTAEGIVVRDPRIERAAVDHLDLADFDVDDYRLRAAHHAELDRIVGDVGAGLRTGRYLPQVLFYVRGETSSTATDRHNLELSKHRAFNVGEQLKCRLQKAGLNDKTQVKWLPIGESLGQTALGDERESEKFRRVRLMVIAPIPACSCPPPGPRPPGPRPRFRRRRHTGARLCVSVPRIAPRSGAAGRPDILSLARVVAGLPAPAGIVTNATATVRIDRPAKGSSAEFELRGWGLEIALPSSGSIDLRTRLHATLDAIMRASASLGASLRVGPFGLRLRFNASVFTQALVRLIGDARLQINAAIRPNFPELQRCRPVAARAIGGRLRLSDLAGPALLVVPGAGLGPATLRLAAPGILGRRVQLSSNPIVVPADKSTVRTVLVIAGTLSRVRSIGIQREDEAAAWGEDEMQPETVFESPWTELPPAGSEVYAGV